MTNPFTPREQRIISDSQDEVLEELGPYMDPELYDMSPLQEHFSWSECLQLLSSLDNIQHSRKYKNIYFDPEIDTLRIKIYKLAIDELKNYRLQECPKKCGGYLVFFSGENLKVPVTSLIPDKYLEKLGPPYTEDMLGYIVAICPKCEHVQLYDPPEW